MVTIELLEFSLDASRQGLDKSRAKLDQLWELMLKVRHYREALYDTRDALRKHNGVVSLSEYMAIVKEDSELAADEAHLYQQYVATQHELDTWSSVIQKHEADIAEAKRQESAQRKVYIFRRRSA